MNKRTLALKEVSVQHFQTIRTCPSRSTSAVAKPDPCPTCSRISRTNQKTCGLKAITSQVEKQPAHHARSTTNVHRATHAENYAHCVNCDTNCFKTSGANLLRDSFNLLAQQRNALKWSHRTVAGVSSQLHHVVTILDVSRFAAFCSTSQHPVCIRPIVDSLPDFTNSFSNSA